MSRCYLSIVFLVFVFINAKAKLFIQNNVDLNTQLKMTTGCYDDFMQDYSRELDDLQKTNKILLEKLREANARLTKSIAKFKTSIQSVKELAGDQRVVSTITNCNEVLLEEDSMRSQVYRLKIPNSDLPAFQVLCMKDPNNGPTWTVIQRRQDGSVNFYRGWDDYVHGFGGPYGEFWFGLERMHALTTSRKHELWIQFEDFEGDLHYARYDEFKVGDARSKYQMTKVGFYGNAGDSLRLHNNDKFTTKDADNDKDITGNCAVQYAGAWWYRNCVDSNLNGKYFLEQNSTDSSGNIQRGIEWYDFRPHYNNKYVHMAVRPID